MVDGKYCGNCKYNDLDLDEGPCASCDDNHSNHESKQYTYFVSFYCIDEHGNVVMNNCFIERDEKLRTMEDIRNIREDIKNECNSGNVVIINWKELEG